MDDFGFKVVEATFILLPTYCGLKFTKLMDQHAFKNVNNCLNTNIYSYLETSVFQIPNLYLNVFHFFNTSAN